MPVVEYLLSCQRKLASYYESFGDIVLYTSDKEPAITALHDIYVPMVWKKVQDPEDVRKDLEFKSLNEMFNQVTII